MLPSLRTPLTGSLRHEWDSLARERDPRLLAEGLLNFAVREEQLGRLELAAEVYSLAAESDLDPSVQSRARTRLDAIFGRGAAGPRAELLLRQLAGQASEPSALLAMGLAGSVFRLTRLAALSRLSGSATANFLTRGFGARTLASLAGFALEAPTFTFAGRLGSEALGRSQDWSASALRRDLASSYLVLGGLKFAGWASGATFERLALGGGRERPLRMLAQQGGMLAGILFGHRLEEWTGLRPHLAGATLLTDSLAMLLQFHVAGRLSSQVMGSRFQAWEQGLEARSETLGRSFPPHFPEPLSEALAPDFAFASGREVTLPGADKPIAPQILMMTQGGAGNGDGGDGTGRPRMGRPTLPGLGRDSRPPADLKPAAPYYSETPSYRLAGLSPRARSFSIEAISPKGQDYLARVIEGLDIYFKHYRDPVVVTYGGFTEFDARQHNVLKSELYRMFVEHTLPNDAVVTVLAPQDNRVYHFQKQEFGFTVQSAVLRSSDRRSTLPEIPRPLAPTAPKPGISPRVPPIAPPRQSEPKAASLPATPERYDTATAEDFSGVSQAFRRFLQTMEGIGLRGPAIRLTRGRVDERGLQDLANVLGEHPLPAGSKMTIFWMEKGGGNLNFQWQGDLVRAEWKGFQVPQEAFWLAPVQSRMGQLQVFRASELPSYPFEGFRNYERAVEKQMEGMFARFAIPGRYENAAGRRDGAARRGEILGRLAMHWLKENNSLPGRTMDESAQRDFIEIHRLLERAQAFLDLGTLRRFSELLGRAKLKEYADVVVVMNRPLAATKKNLLIPMEDFGSGLPGEAALPLHDTLLAAFSDQVVKANGGARIPLENNTLLSNPLRLAACFRETLRSRALPLLAAFKLAEKNAAGEDINILLQPGRRDLGESHQKLRSDLEFFLDEWPEFGRILREGRGPFHRAFIADLFQGPRSIRDLYSQVLAATRTLSPELRRTKRLEDLPTLNQLDAFARGSRP